MADDPTDLAQAFREADALHRRGELDAAEAIYRGILGTAGEQFETLHRLGILSFQKGRYAEALRFLGAALMVRPADAAALSDFGLVQATLGDLEGALASYDQALVAKPDFADAYSRRGDGLRALGRPAEALASYDRALALDPRLAQTLNNRGLALMALGRPHEALASYDAVLAFSPDYVLALCNRGRTLQALERADEALASYDQALAVQPDHLEALNNRGALLQDLGRPDEALASYDRALTVNPDYLEALNNRGNLLGALGRAEAALASYDRALALNPNLGLILNNRGNLLRDLGRLGDAVASYDRALAMDADFAEALRNRGLTLWMLDRPEAALADCDRALALDPDHAKALNIRGLALVSLGRPDEALASYDRALALAPNFADAHGNRGMLLAELGRLDEAVVASERAIALEPRAMRAYYNLTLSKTLAPDDAHLAAMRALAEEMASCSVDDQIHLRFALAKALADIGDPAGSFDHLLAGAALKRGQTAYDEAATLAGFERSKTTFTEARMRALRGLGDLSPAPVFIVGMPRSGTTLIEQILASHPDVFAAGESPAFAQAAAALGGEDGLASGEQLRRLGADYLHRIGASAGAAARITNKTPDNFQHLGLIHLALPEARILHVRRDPLDTCVSCFSKLFGGDLPYTYDLAELGRYYRGYQTLMEHWRAVLPPGVLLEVDYEHLVADLEGQVRRILAHCGLDWDPRCLDFHLTRRWVRTASAAQVRRPIYHNAIGRWRAHQAKLKPLIDALEPERMD